MSTVSRETDVIIIGSGGCGLAAALTAAEAGARVILFEKQRSLGGTSNFFEGTFAVESPMQRERYLTYTRDEAFKGMMEYSHWRANARMVRAFVDESASTIAWLQEAGVEFSEVGTNMPDGPRTYHIVKEKGAAVVKALAIKAKEKGVDLRLGTPVTRIIKEGDRISGVIVDKNGDAETVQSPVVIIASGGYANNKAWVKKYAGFDIDVNMIPVGNVDKMGDGIRMAWDVGAAEEGMGVLEAYPLWSYGPGIPHLWSGADGCPPARSLGQSGRGAVL